MTAGALFTGFQGWIDSLFGSVWTYAVLVLFFVLLIAWMLVHLLRARISKNITPEPVILKFGNGPAACEEKIIHSIEALGGSSKTVLLAAASLECMPVTIPVRIAMNHSEKNRRCLLIDLDTRRNAIWKVFGLDSQNPPVVSFPAPSGIKNLAILPAHYFDQNKWMNIRSITQNAQKQYDLILINAPFLDGHPDRKMIAASCRYVLVFTREISQTQRLQNLCREGRCKVLGYYTIQKNGSPTPAASCRPLRP